MIEQHFHNVVHQVAGGNIENQHGEEAREIRRQELLQRQHDHLAARDATERRLRRSPYRWATLVCLLSVAATGVYEFQHFSAVHWLWPVQIVLLVMAGAASLIFEHIRRDCRAWWHHHNEAIKEINKALHVI